MTLALGLIGCGVMGRRHVLGMARLQAVGRLDFALAAVCDVVPESAGQLAALAEARLGRAPQTYASVEALLREAGVDGVLITTTPDTHPAVALSAFAAGLDVLAEKPLALTVAEGRALVDAARAAGRTLAVAENYRRDPINRLGQALVAGGAIGKTFLAVQASSGSGERVIMTPWRHRRDRGGILLDMGVHYADILEYYLGPIDTVAGLSAVVDHTRLDANDVPHPADAEDLSAGVLRFRGGALGHWLVNLAGRGEASFTRIFYGTSGSLSVPGDRSGQPLRLWVRQGGGDKPVPPEAALELVPDFALDTTTAALFGGERLAAYDLPWAEIDANLLAIEQADFVAAVRERRAPEVDGAQGLRSVALIEGLLESERLGRHLALDELLQPAAVPTLTEAQP